MVKGGKLRTRPLANRSACLEPNLSLQVKASAGFFAKSKKYANMFNYIIYNNIK